jgi:pyruvate dehydrogenase E1 component
MRASCSSARRRADARGEGGAHQSINSPLIGMGQPNLDLFRTRLRRRGRADDAHAFEHMQATGGKFGLSAPFDARDRRSSAPTTGGRPTRCKGGYWLREPGPGAEAAIVFTGAIAPEAARGVGRISAEDMPGLGLLNVTSPDLLHRGWSARRAARWSGGPGAFACRTSARRARAGRGTGHGHRRIAGGACPGSAA